MGKSVRAVPNRRMSQKWLDSLITNPSSDYVRYQTEEIHNVLYGCEDYDTTHPEEAFKSFCASIRSMLSRYEDDSNRLSELDQQIQDLLHYIELSGNKNANTGYKLYKKLCEIRRERRKCKNELDLLQPVVDAFNESGLLSKLTDIQGKCKTVKRIIDNRGYTIKTNVLEDI